MLLRGTATVSILTLLSRVLGFVRDLLVAKLLGASLFADAFFVAFRIPNLLRSFVAEGALTSAFVPVFSSILARDQDEAFLSFRRVLGFLIFLTTPLTLLGIFFSPEIVDFLAPGFSQDQEKWHLCTSLTRIMMPYIACVSVIAMINSALNALHIFGASAWAQVTMNLVLIVGALLAITTDPNTSTFILSYSVLLGGIIQIVVQVPTCLRTGLSLVPSFSILSRDVAEIVSLMVPATLGASVYQLTIFIATLLASMLPSGSVSWLFYADRVAQFPIGIFSVALASVLLPALSTASARADTDAFQQRLGDSLRFTSFVIIPMAAGIWELALPITQLLFERGAFSHESSIMTSYALKALAVGLWATSCHSMVVRAFIAKKDTLTPTIIGIVSLIVTVLASLLLMGPITTPSGAIAVWLQGLQSLLYSLISTRVAFGHWGLATASSVSAFCSLILILSLFSLKLGRFPWRSFAASTIRSLLAALCMVVALKLYVPYASSAIVACLVGIPLAAATYGLTSFLLRSPECEETLRMVRRASQRNR